MVVCLYSGEMVEIPFASRSLKDFNRINSHSLEDDSLFIDKSDVQLALAV